MNKLSNHKQLYLSGDYFNKKSSLRKRSVYNISLNKQLFLLFDICINVQSAYNKTNTKGFYSIRQPKFICSFCFPLDLSGQYKRITVL